MLPHSHFLIASAVIVPTAFIGYPDKSVQEIGAWVAAGGLASAAIDLDIVALVLIRSRRETRLVPFRSLIEIHRRFALFMDTITETGVLRTGLKTHLLTSAVIISLSYLFAHAYAVPVVAGVTSHILSDLQYLRRLT